MTSKEIQIVAFDNPYPPNFGGVIDIFYKIEGLAKQGVKVYLHYFYSDRRDVGLLNDLCEEVYAYKRNMSLLNLLHWQPYRVRTRYNKTLFLNLKRIGVPILFEGLHSTSVLINNDLHVPIYVRTHNVEHQYTFGLAKSERNFIKKVGHYIEGVKLKYYQNILKKVTKIITLSNHDYNYFSKQFNAQVSFIHVFHGNNEINSNKELKTYGEKYALYHGDLSSPSNILSALFLIDVFKNIEYKLIIAGSKMPKQIGNAISNLSNCIYKKINSSAELDILIQNANVNVLYSNQQSGTKLKVFNALYKGRHVVVNTNIVDDKAILKLCLIANSKSEYIKVINKSFNLEYVMTSNRLETLNLYTSNKNTERFLELFN